MSGHCSRCGGAVDGPVWCACGGRSNEYQDAANPVITLDDARRILDAKRNPPDPEAA